MIELVNLRKTYGDVVAVDDVSFTAADGQITGLLGPNGAGKTTALRMLSGIVAPDRGTATIDDIDITREPERARARLGLLPDTRGLYPRLTARENIRYYGQLHGMARDRLEQRLDEVTELLEMGGIIDRRAEGFSQGERMKVAIGRAIVHAPPNVVLDEPTNGLDVMSIRSLRASLGRLREAGRCVVFSSHVMQEVAALCDVIVIVAQGRVAAAGSLRELQNRAGEDDLEEIFVRLAYPEAA
ncbi:MAG: ATP-binding cassette domain-containing protein [Myxococcota bacterium]